VIVVFGSINLDLVVRVDRLPRPGETVLAPTYDAVPGGKGANQAVAAARAGARVAMVGCVGRDGFADAALVELRAAGVDLAGVKRVAAPTACAMVCVDAEGRNQIAVASGANRETRADQLAAAALGPEVTLVLQLEIDPEANWEAVRRARDVGARIVMNAAPAAPAPAETLRRIDYLVMNEIEAPALARAALPGAAGEDPIAAAAALARAFDLAAIVTLGEAGAVAFAGGERFTIGALDVRVVDTTAAGDAFTGALAAALDSGCALADALRRASVAGGLACETAGAQPSLANERAIEAALPRLPPPEREAAPTRA